MDIRTNASLPHLAVAAVVMTEADGHYVGLVPGQPRLQDLTFTFGGRTVR